MVDKEVKEQLISLLAQLLKIDKALITDEKTINGLVEESGLGMESWEVIGEIDDTFSSEIGEAEDLADWAIGRVAEFIADSKLLDDEADQEIDHGVDAE